MTWRTSLSLNQLLCVAQIHQAGSIQAAAERLSLSASQVSRNLAAVEAEMGSALFVRRGPRLALTAFGREVAPRIAAWCGELDSIIKSGQDAAAGASGRLRLGYTPLTAFTELPAVLTQLKSGAPGLQLDLVSQTDAGAAMDVAEGRLDAALISPPVPQLGISLTELGLDPLALAVPSAWRTGSEIGLDDPQAERVFVAPLAEWPATLQLLLARCEAKGIRPRLEESVDDAIGRMVLALAHDAAALVSLIRSSLVIPGIKVVRLGGLGHIGFRTALAMAQEPTPPARRLAACLSSKACSSRLSCSAVRLQRAGPRPGEVS